MWSPPWKIPVWPAKWVGMGPMLPLFLAALEQTLFLGASGEITDLHSVVITKYVFQVILGWAAHAMRCPQNGGPLRKQLLPVPGFQQVERPSLLKAVSFLLCSGECLQPQGVGGVGFAQSKETGQVPYYHPSFSWLWWVFKDKFFFDLWPIFGRRIAPTPTPTIPTDCISQVLPETCSKLKSSNSEIFSDWRPNSWGQFLSSNMTHRVLGFQRDLSSNYRTP